MIKLTKGNLLKSDAEALVNTVNCAGYMGKGIALQFKKTFPENYEAYHKACKQNLVVAILVAFTNNPLLYSFPFTYLAHEVKKKANKYAILQMPL